MNRHGITLRQDRRSPTRSTRPASRKDNRARITKTPPMEWGDTRTPGAVRCGQGPSVADRGARDYVRPGAVRLGNGTTVGAIPSRPVPRPENGSQPDSLSLPGESSPTAFRPASRLQTEGQSGIPSAPRLSAQLAIAISTPPLLSWCGIDRPSGARWRFPESAGRPRSCPWQPRGAPGRPDTGTIRRRCGRRSRRHIPS